MIAVARLMGGVAIADLLEISCWRFPRTSAVVQARARGDVAGCRAAAREAYCLRDQPWTSAYNPAAGRLVRHPAWLRWLPPVPMVTG